MSLPLHLLRGLGVARFGGSAAGRSVPARGPGVVVDVVGSSQVVLAAFPTRRQPSLRILEGAQGAAVSVLSRRRGTAASGARSRSRYAGWAMGQGDGAAGQAGRRGAVGTRHGRGRSLRGSISVGRNGRALRGEEGGSTGRGGVLLGTAGRRGEIRRQIDDQLSVDDEIVRRLFQVSRQHLVWIERASR